MKIGRREVGEIVRGCVGRKKVKFFGVAEGRFPAPLRRALADRAQIFTHHVPFKVLCPPRLSFGGVMPPTPSFASLQYGLPYYTIIMAGHNKLQRQRCMQQQSCPLVNNIIHDIARMLHNFTLNVQSKTKKSKCYTKRSALTLI